MHTVRQHLGALLQNQPALFMVIGQVAMALLLVALIISPAYSTAFYNSVAEQFIQKHPGREQSAENALRLANIVRPTNVPLALQLEEEALIARFKTGPVREQDLADLKVWAQSAPMPVRAIAREKLIRAELLQARAFLKRSDWRQAEYFAKEALDELRGAGPEPLPYGQQPRYIDMALDVCAQSEQLSGATVNSGNTQSLRSSLRDPEFARDWYQKNGFSNWESDYPPDYAVRYLLAQPHASRSETEQIYLSALADCERRQMPQSTRNGLMAVALAHAAKLQSERLYKQTLNVWRAHCVDVPVTTKTQASIVMALLEQAVALGTYQDLQAMRKIITNTSSNQLFPDDFSQAVIDHWLVENGQMRMWPPKGIKDVNTKLHELDSLENFCTKRHLDNTTVLCAKIQANIMIDNKQAIKALVSELCENWQKRIKHQFRQMACVDALVAWMDDATTPKDAKEAAHLMETMLVSRQWTDISRGRILTSLSDTENRAGELVKRAQHEREIDQIATRISAAESGIALHSINRLIYTCQPQKAKAILQHFKAQVHGDYRYDQLCTWLFGYTRAYPAASDKCRQLARANEFPDAIFQTMPAVAADKSGTNSSDHLLMLLWLAQYELCRGCDSKAIELCTYIVNHGDASKDHAFLPAALMLSEKHCYALKADPEPGPDNRKESARELDNLRSIYLQLHNVNAASHAKKLSEHILKVG